MGELIYLEFFGARDSSAKVRDREASLAEERAHWLQDLSSWPVAFHTGGRYVIDRFTDPERAWTRKGLSVFRDARDGLPGHYDYPALIGYRLHVVRSAIRDLRDARERGQGTQIRECRSALEYARNELLGSLWLFGKRRIERVDIEPHAQAQVRGELRSCLDAARRCDAHARAIRERLEEDASMGAGSAEKERTFSPRYRHALEQQVLGAERIAHQNRERAHEIRSTSDLLRAWGLYR